MSAFKSLRDVSSNFEADLKRLNTELFSVKVGENFEECVAKKLRDLSLFKSKLKLLRAKPLANDPRLPNQESIIPSNLEDYEDTATTKVLEQQIVKFLTQSHAVKALITSPSSGLDPELVVRKEKIIEQLAEFSQRESQLSHLQTLVKEKREELHDVQKRWDNELGRMRDLKDAVDDSMEVEAGPLHRKLSTLVEKMEMMRWLVSRLATARCGRYDWLADPRRRLPALLAARTPCSIEDFTQS